MKTDSQLHLDIEEKLCFQLGINPDNVRVWVKNGVATVNGVVNNHVEKRLIKAVVRNINGLKRAFIDETLIKPVNDPLIPILLR